MLGAAAAASLAGALSLSAAGAQPAAPQQNWDVAISHTPVPHQGCFTAAFPSTVWKEVACVVAPNRPYIPRTGSGGGQTVGDGNDYAAVVSGLISYAQGSFPKVKGLKTENDEGRANTYSLQANSNFMSGSQACDGAANPSKCLAWEQFVYSSGEGAGFMQYWLIDWDTTCPSGWNSFSGDCYKNSSAVHVPLQVIKQLKNLKLSGQAVENGVDTLVLTTKTNAYSTTGNDTVVYLASGWNAVEFNIIGDGGGSEAVFNTGTSLSDEIVLTDGQTTAPTCQPHDGTTGETNNLNLGSCTASGGSSPSVEFTESLAKQK
jgi:hypothetical protein